MQVPPDSEEIPGGDGRKESLVRIAQEQVDGDQPHNTSGVGELGIVGERQRMARLPLGRSVDDAFEDLCSFHQCMRRAHWFSPGAEGRALRLDGARCASLGHWSLITSGAVEASTLSPVLLHAACRDSRLDAIDALVSHYRLDVNDRDGAGGWTALHTATACGNEAACRRLVALGAEDVATADGVRPSSLRPEERLVHNPEAFSAAALATFNEAIGVASVSTDELCHRACRLGESLVTLNTLVPGRVGELAIAAANGRYSLCRLLLELGAEGDRATEFRYSCLHFACGEGHVDCARLLLDYGAPVDDRDWIGGTALHEACANAQRRSAAGAGSGSLN